MFLAIIPSLRKNKGKYSRARNFCHSIINTDLRNTVSMKISGITIFCFYIEMFKLKTEFSNLFMFHVNGSSKLT